MMKERYQKCIVITMFVCIFFTYVCAHAEDNTRVWTCPYCTAILNDQKGFDSSLDSWVCQYCHTLIDNSDQEVSSFDPETAFESSRFPGWYWYCDNCEAFLNIQNGFDDHLDSWICTECGFENAISEEAKYETPEAFLSDRGRSFTPDGVNYYITPHIFESQEQYDFQNAGEKNTMSFGAYTLGHLRVYGDINDPTSYHSCAAFGLNSGDFSFAYDYSGNLLENENDEWSLCSSNGKTVDGITLDHPIGKGCMIIQTSSDGLTYTTVDSFGNLFSDYPTGVKNIYYLNEEECLSGTFFRIIVAYQTRKKVGESNVLFIHNDNFDNRYHTEVYDFYVGYDIPFVGLFSLASRESNVDVTPKLFENSNEYHYKGDVTTRTMAFGEKAMGSFSLFGQIIRADTAKDIPEVTIAEGSIPVICYNYKDVLSNTDSTWELADDGTKKVEDIDIGRKIGLGAYIIQHSLDNKEWETDCIISDIFQEYSLEKTVYPFFLNNDMKDGVYYRVIVAYQTRRKTDTTRVLFVNKDNYEYLKHVEVYTLHVISDPNHASIDIWGADTASEISGFEIWKYGTRYDVTVDGKAVEDGDKFTENAEYIVTVTTPLGKTESKSFIVDNGIDPKSYESENINDLSQIIGEAEIQVHHFDAIQPVNTGKDNGFAERNIIGKNDPHSGWSLGHFTISGFSAKEKDESGNWIFYRVLGESGEEYDDNIVLQFDLKEDIDALHGQTTLTIGDDTETFDQEFNYRGDPFGRGTLLIQHEKPDGSIGETLQHANYLDAKESINANSSLELNEEGDYRIALDYEIVSKGALNRPTNYRIYLTFKVRNGNCTVFAFDLDNNMELENGAITETGFKLAFAESHYLKVFIKHERLSYGVDDYYLNTSFNGFAKEGIPYTEPGLYTITACIPSTGHLTEKQIFVGSKDEFDNYVSAQHKQK